MAREHKEVEKPLGLRLLDLTQSLQVLRDSLEAAQQGRTYALIPMYGQLRALLAEKSKRNQPLLLELARLFDHELRLFVMRGVDNEALPDELADKRIIHLAGFPITDVRVLPTQAEVSIEEFLDEKILFWKGSHYAAKDVIEFFANKAGGAHFSPTLPQDFAEAMAMQVNGRPFLLDALGQIGIATLELGREFLRELAEFELHVVLAIPPSSIGSARVLADCRYPDSPMRWQLALRKDGGIEFSIVGLQDYGFRVASRSLIDWNTSKHVIVRYGLGDQLAARLEFVLNGHVVGSSRHPEPVFLLNDSSSSETYWNRAFDADPNDSGFGLVECAMFKRSLGPSSLARSHLYFEERKEAQRCCFFGPGSWGECPPGQKDLSLHGAQSATVEQVLGRGKKADDQDAPSKVDEPDENP